MPDVIRRPENVARRLEEARELRDREIKRLSYMRSLKNPPLNEVRELEAQLARIQKLIEELRRAG